MKTKLIAVALFSFVLGFVAAWFMVGRQMADIFARQYFISVMDQANVALHIRAGKEMELVKTIELGLPQYVTAIDQNFRRHPDSTNALWMVKAYYERNHLTAPPGVKAVLDALPPKPPTSCQLRLQALDAGKASTNAAVP